jgi:superfamily II DNA or RNA helicase
LLIGDKKNAKERDEAVSQLSERKIRIGIGTNVADEGLDVPVLDRGFITVPTATNKRRIEQQVGRLERMADDKTDAKMFYFWDWKVKKIDKHIETLARLYPKALVQLGNEKYDIQNFKKVYEEVRDKN